MVVLYLALDADRLLPRAGPALGPEPAMWVKHLSSLQFLTLRRRSSRVVDRRRLRVPARAKRPRPRRSRITDEELGAPRRASSPSTSSTGGALPRARQRAHGREEPAVDRRMARERRLRGPSRPRSLEHAPDDRRRRDADRDGALLVRAAARSCGRPLASDGLAQGAFWFTAGGPRSSSTSRSSRTGSRSACACEHGWEYQAAKASMGDWYRAPVGMGAGVMGIGYWCFAATVFLTDLPGAARARAEAERPPLEVPRHGRRRR